ncbi:hypothetical protein ACH3XW_31280 [Acanthocheilonema viteae]
METVNYGNNFYGMKMECLGEVCKIEKCINDIINFIDMWRNLSSQLEATEKMPRYTSLMIHSSNWQARLMAKIELEIDIVVNKLSEQWKEIEEAADMLNYFVTVDWQSQRTILSSCLREDLQHLLSYLMMEVMKWFGMHDTMTYPTVITPMKPNVRVEKIIARCKRSLQAVADNAFTKST